MRDLWWHLRGCRGGFWRLLVVQVMVIGAACVLLGGCALPPPETLVSPVPVRGNGGKYLNPYLADGKLAAWADKGVHANRMGAAVGGFVASGAIGMFDPTGLAAGGSEMLIKQQGAISAAGGQEYMKSTSETSFDRREDLAVYMYVNHSTEELYKKVLELMGEIYPEVGWNYESDVRNGAKKATAAPPAPA